jgi:hypothetical protein
VVFFVTHKNITQNNGMLFISGEWYFRLLNFVPHSYTIDVVHNTGQAYEAALQFGKFTKLLTGFSADTLKLTLSDFHHLTFRYRNFEIALQCGNKERIMQSAEVIHFIKQRSNIADTYKNICRNKNLKKKIIQHDTKISNVLFDEKGRACI